MLRAILRAFAGFEVNKLWISLCTFEKAQRSLLMRGRIKMRKRKEGRKADKRMQRWHLEKQSLHPRGSRRFSCYRRISVRTHTFTHTAPRVNIVKSVRFNALFRTGATRPPRFIPLEANKSVPVWWGRHSFQSLKSSCGTAALSHSCQETTGQVQWDTGPAKHAENWDLHAIWDKWNT